MALCRAAVSLVRTLLCVRVPSNLGLTGEVSLSGELVSVLRLREKIEGAATNHAITNFVVPADNTAADQSSGAQQPPTVVARGLAVSDGQYVMIESPVEVEPSLARRVRVYAAATLLDCLDLALVLAPGKSKAAHVGTHGADDEVTAGLTVPAGGGSTQGGQCRRPCPGRISEAGWRGPGASRLTAASKPSATGSRPRTTGRARAS